MQELRNIDFRNKYIPDICKKIFSVDVDTENIRFIDEGAMNFVYEVTTPKGKIYFKQALQKAKNHEKIGIDLASIPHLRIKYEKIFIDKIKEALPKEIEIPEILSYDGKNNILIMRDVAGNNGKLLQDALLEGDFNEQIASNIGKFLGISHRLTYNKNNTIRGSSEEDMENWKVFLNMRTKGIKSEKEVNKDLEKLYNETLKNHTYNILINMDCCPKNTFQRPDNSIGVIDFELASGFGDPAYDIGFALGHYFLFSVLNNVPKNSINAMKSMFRSYLDEIKDFEFGDLERRMIKYGGAVMLYRVQGSSPAPYIKKDKVQELINKGSEIITNNFNHLNEVFRILKGD